jgi:predicted nuclease of predicted toxin-antitoxin system
MQLEFHHGLLIAALATEHPGSVSVRTISLLGAADQQIWNYARIHGFTIVSKDTDFRERSYLEGSPPKIIWLDVGNSRTSEIGDLLRAARQRIDRFETEDASLLILSIGATAV